ncbi:MAG: SDR family oxidoreductase [Myxococcota bacterium]|nr:SDR family oxidoreductase [Myxococcota bacterium]
MLVTGAASGIGRACALRLGAEGAVLALADRDAAGLAATAGRLGRAGYGEPAVHEVDLGTAAGCREAAGAAVRAHEGLDVLVHAAGVGFAGRIEAVREEDWARVIGVNLSGAFFLTQAALPALLESRGVVVHVASSAGLVGQAYTAPYAAAKAGVVSLVRSMALELAGRGVRVNCVCPGGVDTPLARGLRFPEDAEPDLVRRLLPLLPLGRPEEVAGAVAWLASDEARYATGSALVLDGGQTAG